MDLSPSTIKQLLAAAATCTPEKEALTHALMLSALVYFSNDFITSSLESLGFTYKIMDKVNMKCLVAESPNHIYVAFRGTEPTKWDNWKRILNFVPKKFMYGLEVHGGFEIYYQEYKAYVDSYISTINSTKQVIFTGHSMGAAIAGLYNISYNRNSTSLTFASPNFIFGTPFLSSSAQNYRIMKDFVTWIPFSLPFFKWYKTSDSIKIASQYNGINPVEYHSLENYILSILKS
jgi:hypothetical protein